MIPFDIIIASWKFLSCCGLDAKNQKRLVAGAIVLYWYRFRRWNTAFRYAVLGAGRQGTAAAYDLGRNGEAEKVLLADFNGDQAKEAAGRVNSLIGRNIVYPEQLDVKNRTALVPFLRQVNAFVSAVPYYLNLEIAKCAMEAHASMCDLGGHTEQVFHELALNEDARNAGITLVPDCGMVPGLGTSVCAYSMSLVESPEEVFLWDGGLPQNPKDPWNYILTFHFEGLVNEYFGTTEFLRDGKLVQVKCFEEYELVDFPQPIGQLEAFTTAGGTSSAPRTFLGKLKTYQNKTLRYKGHFAQWKAFHDAGLLELQAVQLKGASLRPRDLLERILEPKIKAKAGEKDVCIIRAKCVGRTNGKKVERVVDLFDYHDESTGFTSMERTTGWHAAIVASMMAHNEIPKGAIPVELAVPGDRMIRECRNRGMKITETADD
jgi:lysine 6-dehydrogenase